MILKNKKLLLITSLLTLLPIPVGLALWDRFPEVMAVHWGVTGQADGFASVPFAVFAPPLIMLAVQWLCILMTALDKGNKNRNRKSQALVLWIIPVVCNLSCCGIYALALDVKFSPVAWTIVPMGILFSVIGNYLPKTRMNAVIGIKVPTTYTSEENWNATHRLAGKIWVVGGILTALCGFLPHAWAIAGMFTILSVLVIIPVCYSWRYYRQELAQGKVSKCGYSKTDRKIAKGSAVFLIVLAIFIGFVLFHGDIRYVYQEDYLKVESNMYTDYIVRYDTIESVEFREGNVPGLRVGGYGSYRLLMGYFQNQEFGTYMRYTYYKPEACVVLAVKGKTVVLSGETREETENLYLNLLDLTAQ